MNIVTYIQVMRRDVLILSDHEYCNMYPNNEEKCVDTRWI